MHIILDVDCVVADLVGALLEITGKNNRELASEYDWFEQYEDKEETRLTRKAMSNPNFWETLPLMPNAIEGVQYLRRQGHKIIWCTMPYEKCFGWVDMRRKWLENNFQSTEHQDIYIPTKDKWCVRGSCIIDDRIDIVEAWEQNNPEGIGFVFQSELNIRSPRSLVTWETIMNSSFFH